MGRCVGLRVFDICVDIRGDDRRRVGRRWLNLTWHYRASIGDRPPLLQKNTCGREQVAMGASVSGQKFELVAAKETVAPGPRR